MGCDEKDGTAMIPVTFFVVFDLFASVEPGLGIGFLIVAVVFWRG